MTFWCNQHVLRKPQEKIYDLNLSSKEGSDGKSHRIENLGHFQIMLGGTGQISTLRPFFEIKRWKKQIV